MSDDKIVNFPGTSGPDKLGTKRVTADDVLSTALGKYEEVILIGINPGKAQCISTIPVQWTIFELSRAIHRIHDRPDLKV